ncbi:MAG: methylmalonyl-CoA mutase, partial [Chitinophagaceae bacterium]
QKIPGFRIDDSIRQVQMEKLVAFKNNRDPAKCDNLLQQLNDAASGGDNIMPIVIDAVEQKCTLGEIADTLRELWGEYKQA